MLPASQCVRLFGNYTDKNLIIQFCILFVNGQTNENGLLCGSQMKCHSAEETRRSFQPNRDNFVCKQTRISFNRPNSCKIITKRLKRAN